MLRIFEQILIKDKIIVTTQSDTQRFVESSEKLIKNHISADNKNKVIHRYAVISAKVHDSQVFDELLDESNSNRNIWADPAYRNKTREEELPNVGVLMKLADHLSTRNVATSNLVGGLLGSA